MKIIRLVVLLALGLTLGQASAGEAPKTLHRTPFGVVGIHNEMLKDVPQLVSRIQALNTQWVRVSLGYNAFQPAKRALVTPVYKDLVGRLSQSGIQVLGQIVGNRENADWNNPKNLAAFKDQVEYLLKTFPEITHWEIWNEPDCDNFFGQASDPDLYMQLVKLAYGTIKARSPKLQVAVAAYAAPLDQVTSLPGTRHYPRFMEACYERGVKDFCDIVSFHDYTNIKHPQHGLPLLKAKIGEVVKLMEKYGDGDKPIWLSEFGVPRGLQVSGPGQMAEVTPEDQAAWLVTCYEEIPRYRNVETIFWMCLKDWTNTQDSSTKVFGLYHEDWTPWPAATAFADLAKKFATKPTWTENVEPFDLSPLKWIGREL